MEEELVTAFSDGTCLLGAEQSFGPSSNLKNLLEIRLSEYYLRLGAQNLWERPSSLEAAQLLTASEALSVIERVQKILGPEITNSDSVTPAEDPPAIGTRDLGKLRTLVSLIFKWGVDPSLHCVLSRWSGKSGLTSAESKESDTRVVKSYKYLSATIPRLYSLVFLGGIKGSIPQTYITSIIFNRHVTDFLRPSLILGWLPRAIASGTIQPLDDIRPLALRLLTTLPPSQTITSLGSVLSSTTNLPPYVRAACSTLLSKQLLRPEGVQGLCEALFGEEMGPGNVISQTKFEHFARVLLAIPANITPENYFQIILPRIVLLLSDQMPLDYRRAAAFFIARTSHLEGKTKHMDVAFAMLRKILHGSFLEPQIGKSESPSTSILGSPSSLSPSIALSFLVSLIANADPSPSFVSHFLSPVVPSLYSLLHYLGQNKSSDPVVKESLRGMLKTWGKVVDSSEIIEALWCILGDDEERWEVGQEGGFVRLANPRKFPSLSFLTPQDTKQSKTESDESDFDMNLFNQYPDPVDFVRFLKDMDRPEIISEIFVKLLEIYRTQKFLQNSNSMRILLYLQIIMQMQKQFSEGATNMLRKPEHILSFIKHVLESAQETREPPTSDTSKAGTLHLVSFRLDPSAEELHEEDSDDDMPESERMGPDEEMIGTAVDLLLSIFEANEHLTARNTPILNDIFSLLEPLIRHDIQSIRQNAREARMVITARLASTSRERGPHLRGSEQQSAQEVYQKSLKLLQDPILPVRAHGLLLLRQLVAPTVDQQSHVSKTFLEPALVPAILSIFLQSVQDEDSYIYLNAIQGLAGMADKFGRDVLTALMKDYIDGLDGLIVNNLTRQDIDVRIRIGEAMGTVIKRFGGALGMYVDLLIPPLSNIARSHHAPIVLRTSSLSLLAECINVCFLAALPYVEDLGVTMIDLLQIETSSQPPSIEVQDAADTLSMDSHPTSTNSEFPPLRRAALHLFSRIIGETTNQLYDSSFIQPLAVPLSSDFLHRARITLSYISSTDVDNVVRIMAREAKESMVNLQRVFLGL